MSDADAVAATPEVAATIPWPEAAGLFDRRAPAAEGAARRAGRGLLLAAAAWLAMVGVVGLVFFLYHYLGEAASRHPGPALPELINESTGAFAVGLMIFPMRRLVGRLPLSAGRRARRLPLYAVTMVAAGAAATTLIWGLRSVLYPLAGLGRFDYGVMPLRYVMELPLELLVLVLMATALHTLAALDRARARELRTARVEASLARAQLQNLRLQLQPHFLFNALHTISATMYEDPAAADEMLAQLAELLRLSLSTARTDEVTLDAELELLRRYIAIQHARFGDRLDIRLQIAPETLELLVPSLLLQPLVENAIRHGNAERRGHGRIVVRARRQGDVLTLEVEDDGSGASATGTVATGATAVTAGSAGTAATKAVAAVTTSATAATAAAPRNDPLTAPRPAPARPGGESGLGLAATAGRLQLLYGDRHTWQAGSGATGGFLVRATLPARRAPRAAAASAVAAPTAGDDAGEAAPS